MEHIDAAKEAILSVISSEPVKETEDVISAYTLFNAIREQKRRLSCIGEVEKGLLDKLNDIYPKEVTKGKRKLFKKTPDTVINYFDGISHGFNSESSNISFKIRNGNHEITILKDFDIDGAYSLEETVPLDEEAYIQCEDDIQKVLSTIEYYGGLFSLDINTDNRGKSLVDNKETVLSNKFSYKDFDLSISFDSTSCRFDYSYGLNQEIDPYASSYRTCYGFGADNTLRNTVLENEETILKNIPINMSDLSFMFSTIVYDYRNREARRKQEEKVKVHEKQIIRAYNQLKINED